MGLGWEGLEPSTNALKGRCSTIELPTRREGEGKRILRRRNPEILVPTRQSVEAENRYAELVIARTKTQKSLLGRNPRITISRSLSFGSSQQNENEQKMVEVQSHGFSFEKWVCDTLFEGYSGEYMQKWDVPPDHNQNELIPPDLRSIPVSVKSAKYGSPIGLGDVVRQRSIDEPFLLIAGFWRQRSPSEKWFEDIGWVKFSPAEWSSLWGSLSLRQLTEIDHVVKNQEAHYSLVRKQAQEWKTRVASNSSSQIVINPKIDSKKQRRVQCSLPFHVFWDAVGRKAQIHDNPMLFGLPFDNPVISSSRSFNRD